MKIRLKTKNWKREIGTWQSLVHVCQQWRRIVFGSPRRLNLRIMCTQKTPVRDMLDVWPAFPVLVSIVPYSDLAEGEDNIVAALERSDRIHRIELILSGSSPLKNVLAAMQEPFPELTHLRLQLGGEAVPVVPDSFLGGCAPRLQSLWLYGIPFPGLPKLLLSVTHLIHLRLECIPPSGYHSPEEIVAALSALTSLGSLFLDFYPPNSHPDQDSQRPPAPTRTVLPALTNLCLKGHGEYLENFVACIDTPRLHSLYMTFYDQVEFDTPQLGKFISRTPMSNGFEQGCFAFEDYESMVNLSSSQTSGHRNLDVTFPCRDVMDWQFSPCLERFCNLKRVCTLSLPPLHMLENLYIYGSPDSNFDLEEHSMMLYGIENAQWLGLLRPFAAAKNLYLSERFAPHIVPALEELVVGGRTIEVFPALQNIFLERLQPLGPVQEGIGQFVAARQATSNPIALSRWDRHWDST
jgi:hypothetical protein